VAKPLGVWEAMQRLTSDAGPGVGSLSVWETTDSKPSDEESTCTLWAFADAARCPRVECESLRTCTACLAAPIEYDDFEEEYAGCGWCTAPHEPEPKCMTGTPVMSNKIILPTEPDEEPPEPPPQCMGEGNWTMGSGRCDCYKKCDECTENDCGWCDSSKTCLEGTPHAGLRGAAPLPPDLKIKNPMLKQLAERRRELDAVRHRWHNFRNGPGVTDDAQLYVNRELEICSDWHWRSCPCQQYDSCERCLLKGSCSWCIDYPDAKGPNGRCNNVVDSMRDCPAHFLLDWGCGANQLMQDPE